MSPRYKLVMQSALSDDRFTAYKTVMQLQKAIDTATADVLSINGTVTEKEPLYFACLESSGTEGLRLQIWVDAVTDSLIEKWIELGFIVLD